MQLEHAAVWPHDLERLKPFYVDNFGATPGARYVNERRGFTSYFLSFDAGARLEIMAIAGWPRDKVRQSALRAGWELAVACDRAIFAMGNAAVL